MYEKSPFKKLTSCLEFQHQCSWWSQLFFSETHNVTDGKDSLQSCAPQSPRILSPCPQQQSLQRETMSTDTRRFTKKMLWTQKKYWCLREKSFFLIFKIFNSQNVRYENDQREFLPLCETCAHILAHAHFWIWTLHGIFHKNLLPKPVVTNVFQ